MQSVYQDNEALAFLASKGVSVGANYSIGNCQRFFTKDVDGAAGYFPILLPSDKFLEGVRNFDSAQFPQGHHVVVKGIQLRVAVDTNDNEGAAAFKSVATGAPGDYLNSTLLIKVANDVICEEKIEDLLTEIGTEGLGGEIFFPFRNWKHIEGGRTIDAQLICPTGETIQVTNKLLQKVKFVGTEVKLK